MARKKKASAKTEKEVRHNEKSQKTKIKKVIKGLTKASKTHAAQAKTLKGVINGGSKKGTGKKT